MKPWGGRDIFMQRTKNQIPRTIGNWSLDLRFCPLGRAIGTDPEHMGDAFSQGSLAAHLSEKIILVSAVNDINRGHGRSSNATAN